MTLTATAGPAPAAVTTEPERRRGPRVALGVYGASRALVLVTAGVAVSVHGGDEGRGPWPALQPGPAAVRALTRWDSAWYLDIARHGYSKLPTAGGPAFFPLLPLLVAIGHGITRLPVAYVGLALTLVAGGAAVALVWRLVDSVSGPDAADRAACLIALFPGAFAFSVVYSEALLLVGAAGCLYALQRRWWVVAGALGAVASASRPTGIVIVAACAWAAWRARDRRAIAAPVLAAVGVGAYLVYSRVHGGMWTLWLRSERDHWQDRMDWGGETWHRFWTVLVHGPRWSWDPLGLNDLVGALGLVFLVAALVLLWRWRPPGAVTIYALGAIAMAVVSNHVGPRPRMLLAAFPLVAAVGIAARGRAYYALLAVSTVALVAMSAIIFTTEAITP